MQLFLQKKPTLLIISYINCILFYLYRFYTLCFLENFKTTHKSDYANKNALVS